MIEIVIFMSILGGGLVLWGLYKFWGKVTRRQSREMVALLVPPESGERGEIRGHLPGVISSGSPVMSNKREYPKTCEEMKILWEKESMEFEGEARRFRESQREEKEYEQYVQKTYKELARIFHPDKYREGSELSRTGQVCFQELVKLVERIKEAWQGEVGERRSDWGWMEEVKETLKEVERRLNGVNRTLGEADKKTSEALARTAIARADIQAAREDTEDARADAADARADAEGARADAEGARVDAANARADAADARADAEGARADAANARAETEKANQNIKRILAHLGMDEGPQP